MECQTELSAYIDLSGIIFNPEILITLKKFEVEAFLR